MSPVPDVPAGAPVDSTELLAEAEGAGAGGGAEGRPSLGGQFGQLSVNARAGRGLEGLSGGRGMSDGMLQKFASQKLPKATALASAKKMRGGSNPGLYDSKPAKGRPMTSWGARGKPGQQLAASKSAARLRKMQNFMAANRAGSETSTSAHVAAWENTTAPPNQAVGGPGASPNSAGAPGVIGAPAPGSSDDTGGPTEAPPIDPDAGTIPTVNGAVNVTPYQ